MKKNMAILLALTQLFMIETAAFADVISDVISNPQYAHSYTDSIFNGNAAYLMQERFDTAMSEDISGVINSFPSGWDIDYRGGRVVKLDDGLAVLDGDDAERIKLNKKILKHTEGELVFETAFTVMGMASSGYYYRIFGGGATALRLETAGDTLCYLTQSGGLESLASCSVGTACFVKAVFSMSAQTVALFINGAYQTTAPFAETVSVIDEIEIGTGIEQDCYIKLRFVNFYINYALNERFMTAPLGATPAGWILSAPQSGCGISAAPGSPYRDDANGYRIVSSAAASSISLSASFPAMAGKTEFSWSIFIPEKKDGIKISLKSGAAAVVGIETLNGNWQTGGLVLRENYRANMWHNFRLVQDTDADAFDLYLNYKLVQSGVPAAAADSVDAIEFAKTGALGEFTIDDITVCAGCGEYGDYPQAPVVAQSDGYDVGMVSYPMWREGAHFGWDTIAPYDDERKSYLGYYTEGSPEVSDWENKWLLEHGVDYMIYPFVRPNSQGGEPVKKTVRGEAFHDGYLYSKYSAQLRFAVLLSAFTAENYFGQADFVENVLPYLVEYYFKDPRYMTVNNKPIIYTYNFDNIVTVLGNGSSTQGVAVFSQILAALRQAVQELGYDDVILAADANASVFERYSPQITGLYQWRYGWGSSQDAYVINGLEAAYQSGENVIASIPMGYDTTPWRASSTGFMEVDEIGNICDYVVQKTSELRLAGNESAGLVTFTCWNEYGEGHYFAPSTLHGFDYLNVIRNAFTQDGVLQQEALPSETALARMGVLYPTGRGALKSKADKAGLTQAEIARMSVVHQWTFASAADVSAWKKTRCTAVFDSVENAMVCTATANDPIVVLDIADLGIEASGIQAVRIRAYAEGGNDLKLHYATTEEEAFGNNKNFYCEIDGSGEYQDYILMPALTSKLSGKLLSIRIDPTDDIMRYGGNFGIKSVELLGGYNEPRVFLDGKPLSLTSGAIEGGGALYIPIYLPLIADLGAYAVWDHPQKILTVEKEGKRMAITAGSSIISVDGTEKDIGRAPFYQSGNLFVPYSGIMEELGYAVRLDQTTGDVSYESPHYGELIKNENYPYVWNFDVDGDCEGWRGAYTAKIKAKDGALRISGYNTDPIVSVGGVGIDPSTYRYAVVRIKNASADSRLTLRFFNAGGARVDYTADIPASGDFNDYIFDLNSNAGWSSFGAAVSVRIDPTECAGVSYIDSVRILKQLPSQSYFIEASESYWGDNIVNAPVDANSAYFSGSNVAGWSGATMPLAEVDGFQSVEIAPSDAAKDALLSVVTVLYNGAQQSLNAVCDDDRVIRVSFRYKSKGNCSQVMVENRKASYDITDREYINDASASEWRDFMCEFDLANSTADPANKRWITIRVQTDPSLPNAGLYVRDLKIECLEEREATSFDKNTISLKAYVTNSSCDGGNFPFTLIVAEYSRGVLKNGAVTKVPKKPF